MESEFLIELAKTYGTPLYVYDQNVIETNWRAYSEALTDMPHLICYAVKANSNLAILGLLAKLGAGFDIVSGGELYRCLQAGVEPKKIVFSGVGKTSTEITAALKANILCFNVESSAELQMIEALAKALGVVAPISIRINPDVEASTHPYIATGLAEHKFGVNLDIALGLYLQAADSKHLNPFGIDCHIGSQITSLAPFQDALSRVLVFYEQLQARGIAISHINLGGGLGIDYEQKGVPACAELASLFQERLSKTPLSLILEPGRSIVGQAGVLLSQVILTKQNGNKHFAVIDAAMNDCLRPALYQAYHPVRNLSRQTGATACYDIVGAVCESGDFLAQSREMVIEAEDVLAIDMVGAYGFSMSSNYNTRPRCAEVLVNGSQHRLIRKRETVEDLLQLEKINESLSKELV